MRAELVCFNRECRAHYAIDAVVYNCTACGGLLEACFLSIAFIPECLTEMIMPGEIQWIIVVFKKRKHFMCI